MGKIIHKFCSFNIFSVYLPIKKGCRSMYWDRWGILARYGKLLTTLSGILRVFPCKYHMRKHCVLKLLWTIGFLYVFN
uniref:Uncharacterized protein n=1 Tax=Megaselia scalaris TaxID=36166 RepID=T1GWH6_MEGSC